MPGSQLLLINPKPKRRRRKKNARRRHHARRRNPHRARRVGGYRIKRRRHKNPLRSHRRRKNPMFKRRRHRRHRNPLSVGGLKNMLVPAAVGAAGAIGVNMAFNFVKGYLPATLTSSPYIEAAAKIAAAVGLGMLAKKFIGSGKADAAIMGAITIELYGLASTALAGSLPSGFAGLNAYLPGMSGLGAYSSPNPSPYLQGLRGMGAYVAPRTQSLQGFGGLGLGMAGIGGMPGSFSTDN